MLIELRIQDFLVIDSLTAEFGSGLTALTGETGAGKSILAGALALLLGERAYADVVRTGAKRARVEGVFDTTSAPKVAALLDHHGLAQEGDLLILRREVVREGRNRAWVNGSPVTAALMVELGAVLVDLHGQHAHQRLLDRSEQRQILDAYAGTGDLVGQVSELYRAVTDLEALREKRLARAREIAGRADFLRFQHTEIRDADPSPDEEESLLIESGRLAHSEDLASQAEQLHQLLYAGQDAVADRLSEAKRSLERLAQLDPRLEAVKGTVEGAFHAASEAGRELASYAAGIEHDPAKLEEIRARLALLGALRRKYGTTLMEVIEAGRSLAAELEELDSSEIELSDLEREIAAQRSAYEAQSTRLTRLRDRAARSLSKAVQELLPRLGLEGATFQILLERLDPPRAAGAESIEFRASLNPGFEPRPLARIASGGELSRIMLALNSVLSEVDPVPTLIFDEVDAGIGGVVATSVAKQLRSVAARRQVFVITHLAQIASAAGAHYRVLKSAETGIASSELHTLSGESRVEEIARMLGGDPESGASRAHAQELLAG